MLLAIGELIHLKAFSWKFAKEIVFWFFSTSVWSLVTGCGSDQSGPMFAKPIQARVVNDNSILTPFLPLKCKK